MPRPFAVFCLVAFALAGCQPAPKPAATPSVSATPAPTAADAKAFLTALYAHYTAGPSDFGPTFTHQSDYFDPAMLVLMNEDARLRGDEVGALDGDPICDCQDFGKLSAQVTIDSAISTEAKATVIVTETDPAVSPKDRKPRTFTYDLAAVNGQWRIHDMTTPSLPSLRQLFVTSNKEMAAYAASSASASSS